MICISSSSSSSSSSSVISMNVNIDIINNHNTNHGNNILVWRYHRAEAHLGRHCLSKATYSSTAASFVFYGTACLIRLIEFSTLFAVVEENLR